MDGYQVSLVCVKVGNPMYLPSMYLETHRFFLPNITKVEGLYKAYFMSSHIA